MSAIQVTGFIDAAHRLIADVPSSMQPGQVTVLILSPTDRDDTEDEWISGVTAEWAEELGDTREDIYTIEDGVPLREA